jgi:hypothetical protein
LQVAAENVPAPVEDQDTLPVSPRPEPTTAALQGTVVPTVAFAEAHVTVRPVTVTAMGGDDAVLATPSVTESSKRHTPESERMPVEADGLSLLLQGNGAPRAENPASDGDS